MNQPVHTFSVKDMKTRVRKIYPWLHSISLRVQPENRIFLCILNNKNVIYRIDYTSGKKLRNQTGDD